MRKGVLSKLALVAIAVPVAAAAAGQDERLVSPAQAGFIEVFDKANQNESIREEVPRGETLQRWTRMVTTQRFFGLAARATPRQYADNMLGILPQRCPGARTPTVAQLTVSGRPAIRFQVDCPRGAGGRPESFILLAVAGQRDMHVKQVAFRGPPTAADLQWGQNLLSRTVLCAPRDRQAACR